MDFPSAVTAIPALVLAVLGLATYRITRFIVHDEFLGTYPDTDVDPDTGEELPVLIQGKTGQLEPDRGTGLRRLLDLLLFRPDPDTHKLEPKNRVADWFGTLLTCPHCVGVWIAAGSLWAWMDGPPWMRWVLLAAAIAGVNSFVSSRPAA